MAVAVLIHAFLFLVFWLTNLSFQQAMNTLLSNITRFEVNFLRLFFLFFAVAVFLWSVVRLVLQKNNRTAGPDWLYNVIGGFFLVFFYGSFVVLFLKVPIQPYRLGQFTQYFRIFVDTVILSLAAWGLRFLLAKLDQRWLKRILIGALLLFWLVPVFWPPGAVYRRPLPEKPLLIAHRGASMLAPENTLASMQVAADLGVYGLETDVSISNDGVLFLMHDPTLKRTTNVAEVFPGRKNDVADSFTWNELSQLDAGGWFKLRALYSGEPIPTLTEFLRIVQENDLAFIYDLRRPSDDHPFANSELDMTLAEIKASGAASRTWVLTSPDEIPVLRAALPESVLAKGLNYRNAAAPQELVDAGYQLVNSEYGLSSRMIQAYQKAGLWVNLWTVDEPWQYSRLWLAGADSVASNNVQTLIAMSRPVMAIAYPVYMILWGMAGLLAVGIVFLKKTS